MKLPEELRKAERTVQEAVESAEIEVEVYEESDGFINSKNKFDLLVAKQREVSSRKWLPSDAVAFEWERREKEHASFFEAARKKLHDVMCGCDRCDDSCLTFRRIVAVFGGER